MDVDPTVRYLDMIQKNLDVLRNDATNFQSELRDFRRKMDEINDKKASKHDIAQIEKTLEGWSERLSKDVSSISSRLDILAGQPESLAALAKRSNHTAMQVGTLIAIIMGVLGFGAWAIPMIVKAFG